MEVSMGSDGLVVDDGLMKDIIQTIMMGSQWKVKGKSTQQL